MLWLHQTNTRGRRMGVRGLLSAALQNGWRIVRASPEEQALLDAHGFGSGRIQSGGQKPSMLSDPQGRRPVQESYGFKPVV
jgi:hypothetical protein